LLTASVTAARLALDHDLLQARPFGILVSTNDPHDIVLVSQRLFTTDHKLHGVAWTAVDSVAVPRDFKHASGPINGRKNKIFPGKIFPTALKNIPLGFFQAIVEFVLKFHWRAAFAAQPRKPPLRVRLCAKEDVLSAQRFATKNVQNTLQPRTMVSNGCATKLFGKRTVRFRVNAINRWRHQTISGFRDKGKLGSKTERTIALSECGLSLSSK
jgi:hypothetical protein